ncbi:MAG: AMP-binding protein, partial [Acidimicrobiia bacterium]|nr:AMP-binding protein [Acidimicrobiia bacterium]
MSPFPLPPLLHRWGADDLTTLMRRRCAAGEDGARIGFWDRGAQAYREEAQSSFFARATALAEQQAEFGTSPGSHVLVACDDPEATLLGFVSSVLLGSVPAVVAVRSGFDPPAVVAERLRRTRSLLGPGATAVVEPATAEAVQATGGGAPSVMVDPRAPPSHVTGTLDGLRSAPGSVSHLQLTSGSTGVGSDGGGKAVIVTHRSLFANLAAMSRRLELDEDSVIVTWLPLYHDMGLVGQAILALVHEIDLFLMTPFDFVLEPARWLRTISERRGTMSASPTFGY